MTVTWREKLQNGKVGASLLPERYGKVEQTPLKAMIQAGMKDLLLELKK